jgi:hypothetical protein
VGNEYRSRDVIHPLTSTRVGEIGAGAGEPAESIPADI